MGVGRGRKWIKDGKVEVVIVIGVYLEVNFSV